MQAVLESRDIKDIARQMQLNVSVGSSNETGKGNVRDMGIITSYEISKITGEPNCKVSDRIRRSVPSGREYYYDTVFANGSNSQHKAIALTEKGLNIFIKEIEQRGSRSTQKQIEDVRKIREAVGLTEKPKEEKVEKAVRPIREERRGSQETTISGKDDKIRVAVDNLVMADSFINVVEDRFIGRDYENLTYQERDDFERLFYFMADQLHSRIRALKDIVENE